MVGSIVVELAARFDGSNVCLLVGVFVIPKDELLADIFVGSNVAVISDSIGVSTPVVSEVELVPDDGSIVLKFGEWELSCPVVVEG